MASLFSFMSLMYSRASCERENERGELRGQRREGRSRSGLDRSRGAEKMSVGRSGEERRREEVSTYVLAFRYVVHALPPVTELQLLAHELRRVSMGSERYASAMACVEYLP